MKTKGNFLVIGLAIFVQLLFLVSASHGASITIGGDYTDVGTIIFVSPKPGDTAVANGTALRNTLNGITDAAETNPYIIKLGPGTYDLGTCTSPYDCVVKMKPWVSIEGSGEKATKITASVSGSSFPTTVATVMGADDAELRFLTVENTGTGAHTTAILNATASPSLIHVTATAITGWSSRYGVYNSFSSPTMTDVTATAKDGSNNYGIANLSSSPTMTNVTATASSGVSGLNYGVSNTTSSLTMTNVTATASGGTNSFGVENNTSGTVKINHSVIKGDNYAVIINGAATTYVGNSQLDGGLIILGVGGTSVCAGVYKGDYAFYAGPGCPPH